MTGKKTFSMSQFLEAQKGAESFSALLKACQELDVASLEEEEQVTLAKALRDVAKTKNGPMLVLSLPGEWQAMLALVGMEMPGQDRLAFRGILPRQVVGYLAKHPGSPLFAVYSFAKIGKGDWAYYLERAKELIEPCKRFLERAEVEGGFTQGELVEIAKKTGLVVPYMKLEELSFREVYELYVCGTGAALWEKFPFATLKKDEWEIILGNSKIEIPAAFDEVLKKGMFTREELCRYAETNRRIIPYLQPSEVEARWAVEWLIENKDAALWETYDFRRFDVEQVVSLVSRAGERGAWPKEIVVKVNTFSDGKILELAKKNVINVIGILEVERIVEAGEKFFGELCEVIVWQQGIVQVVIDKLSIGEKPWLKLPRSFLVILLKAVPWGRKFVSWQDFEMKEIDELAKTDESFYKALPLGGKILLKVWRHRVGVVIGTIICVILFCWGLKEYYAYAVRKETAAQRDRIIETICGLNKCRAYSELEKYVAEVGKGRHSTVLRHSSVAAPLAALHEWTQNRAETKRCLGRLRFIASKNWFFDFDDEAKSLFDRIRQLNVTEGLEQKEVDDLRRGYEKVKCERRFTRELNLIESELSSVKSIEPIASLERDVREILYSTTLFANKEKARQLEMKLAEKREVITKELEAMRLEEAARRAAEERVEMERRAQEKKEKEAREREERAKKEQAEKVKRNAAAALINKANCAQDYATLYAVVNELRTYSELEECQRIYPYSLSEPQEVEKVASVYSKGGGVGLSLKGERFKFVGVVKINPSKSDLVVPLLTNRAGDLRKLYCIKKVLRDDGVFVDSEICAIEIFESLDGKHFHKVKGFDYSRCQGLGLFARTH